MELLIKGMVCDHCVAAVRRVFETMGLEMENVALGRAWIAGTLTDEQLEILDSALEAEGFSRITDPAVRLVEQVKIAVVEHVRKPYECRLNLSACLEKHLGVPYDTLSRAFSLHEGRTIEKYHIAQKIEWVKELLGYGEMTVSEIADTTGYSSAAHLSRQFKAVTGQTPSQYMQGKRERNSLNNV